MTISSLAAARLRLLMEQEADAPELGIKLQMTSSGCGSLSFAIAITTPEKNDLSEEIEGIKLFYQEADRSWLAGLVIDLNRETGRFQIFHPRPPASGCALSSVDFS